MEEKLKSLSFTKQQSRHFNRLFFSGACEINVDSQGRIALAGYLKGYANIQREIIIVGVADRMEVWDKKCWNEFYENSKEKFEDIAENLFEV